MNLRDTLITILQSDTTLPTAVVLERLADAADNLLAITPPFLHKNLQDCVQRARAVALVLRSVQEDLDNARAQLDKDADWDKLLGESQDVQAALADEALGDHESGDTEPINCLDTETEND